MDKPEDIEFQSAPRERGERIQHLPLSPRQKVSIRAPRAGRKAVMLLSRWHRSRFNPRPASGAKDTNQVIRLVPLEVSIRAPRAGRKPCSVPRCREVSSFNPRPASGAKDICTAQTTATVQFQSAPRERGERDTSVQARGLRDAFQSAPRERGESWSGYGYHLDMVGFNPRPASGAKVRQW